MYKGTLSKDVVIFKTANATVIQQVGIASILVFSNRFLVIFWVGSAIVSSGSERFAIVIISVISGMMFRILQTARGM